MTTVKFAACLTFRISFRPGIIVENQTKYDLEYVTHSYKVGWPVGDVKKGFEDRGDCKFVLPPGSVGTQLWNLHQGGGFFKFMTAGVIATSCTESYFSVRIRYVEHSSKRKTIRQCKFLYSIRGCVNPVSWISTKLSCNLLERNMLFRVLLRISI